MLQTIEGKCVYVVDFDTMPELPIRGLTPEQSLYERFLDPIKGCFCTLAAATRRSSDLEMYADALTQAIETGVISEPGKYGIHIDRTTQKWEVYKINEES